MTVSSNVRICRVARAFRKPNLDRWQQLIGELDVSGLCRVMTGLDTDSVQMREVSPLVGLLSQDERAEVLGLAG